MSIRGAVLLLAGAPTLAFAQARAAPAAVDRLVRQSDSALVWVFGRPDTPLTTIRAAVADAGATARLDSRWLGAVSAWVRTRQVARLREDARVDFLRPVARFRAGPEPPSSPIAGPVAVTAADSAFGPSATVVRRLNLFPLVQRGAEGRGVRIAILDTGFETELAAFAGVTVAAAADFINGDITVANEAGDPAGQSQHGTQVWSLLAANAPDTIVGIAPGAAYLLAKVEDITSETRLDEDRWIAAVEWADANGADIITSSLNYLAFDDGFAYGPGDLNGDVALTTIIADSAAARGITVVTAAGNLGASFRTLMTPADGDSVISVGAEDTLGVLAPFSSRGPTADGRLKPDLVAPGVGVLALNQFGAPVRVSGTSFAAPLVAGGIALLREFQPALGPVDVRESLRATGTDRAAPDSARGWGRPDIAAATYFPRGVTVTAPGDSLLASPTPTFTVAAAQSASVAAPFTPRVRIARDASFLDLVLDSTLASPTVTLPAVLRPGDTVYVEATMTASDSVAFTALPAGPFVAPPWVELTAFNNAAGSIARTRRPTFTWTSPSIVEPPGPFVYDVTVVRDGDGAVIAEARGLTDVSFVPAIDLERNTPYRWQVTAFAGSDSSRTESAGTFVVTDNSLPTVTLLFQNFPNPFPNPSLGRRATCVWFDLANPGEVRLEILDVRGLVVATLIPNGDLPTNLPAGRYGRPAGGGSCDARFEWDGRAANGTPQPRGLYLVRLVTPDGTFFKRIVFMGTDFE